MNDAIRMNELPTLLEGKQRPQLQVDERLRTDSKEKSEEDPLSEQMSNMM